MRRPHVRRLAAPVALAALMAPALTGAAPTAQAAAAARTNKASKQQPAAPWSRRVQLAKPTDADLLPPTIAISPIGDVTVAYGATDESEPQDAYGELVAGSGGTIRAVPTNTATARRGANTAPAQGALGTHFGKPELIPSAQRVLALGAVSGRLELLTGDGDGGSLTGDTAPDGVQCCMEIDAQTRVAPGFYGEAQQLVTGLDGGSAATLVPEQSGALAVLASGNSIVTAFGSGAKAGFGATSPLATFSGQPPAVAAGTLAGDRALIVWTQPRTALYVPTKGQSVYYAAASAKGVPGTRRLAFKVPAGHSVSQVAVARHRSVASIAWVESWLDKAGAYHSQVFAADLHSGRATGTHPVSPKALIATQISFAGGTTKPEVLTWQACAPGGATCSTQAALRPHGATWGHAVTLGKLDPGAAPVAGMTTNGAALVGWVGEDGVKIASAAAGMTRFARPQKLDRSGSAAHLTVATGPAGTAAAAWTDGLTAQSLHAAFYQPLRPSKGTAKRPIAKRPS